MLSDSEYGKKLYKKCACRGSFRHEGMNPLPGDDVVIEKSDGATYVIDEIKERKNSLIRPPVANLDVMFIVTASAQPSPTEGFADKLTAVAAFNSIIPVIVITKAELDPAAAESIASLYRSCGYEAFITSAQTGLGIDEINDYFRVGCAGKISAFTGVSGVGKSTLMNRMFPQLDCATGELSARIERGKNTTRRVELFEITHDTYLADTPGFSLLDFERFDFFGKDDLVYLFPEYEPYLFKCRFKKCTHTKEDGCEILRAVENGTLSRSRHNSYVEMLDSVKNKKDWERF